MNSTPAGQKTDSRGRFPFGGHLTDLGYAAGWRLVRAMPEFMARNAFDAGAHSAATFNVTNSWGRLCRRPPAMRLHKVEWVPNFTGQGQFILQTLSDELALPCEIWDPLETCEVALPAAKRQSLPHEFVTLECGLRSSL